MYSRLTGLAAMSLAATFLAGSAFATPFTLSEDAGFASGDDYGTIQNITPALGPESSVVIGPLHMLVADTNPVSPGIPQTVYCTDIFHTFQPGYTYTLDPNGLASLGSIKVNQIEALLGHTTPTGGVLGAAVQAAIWEIMNETGVDGYDISSGNFTASDAVNGANFVTDTNGYLYDVSGDNGIDGTWQPIAGQTISEYVPVAGSSPKPNQSFSFIVSSGGGKTTSAPEPASLTVLGLGMLGLAAVRRRRTPHR